MTKEIALIYQKLLREIITLKIKPGARLRENEESERFHVSRTPMRDIFKQLENDGLLVVYSQSGSYVTKIDLTQISNLIFVRSCVEKEVLAEASSRLTSEDCHQLRDLLVRADNLLQSPKEKTEKTALSFFEIDNSFHHLIFEKAGQASLYDFLNRGFPAFQRYRFLTFYRNRDGTADLFAIHNQMIDCLEKGDVHSFSEIAHAHNYSGWDGIQEVRKQYPDYFE